LKNLPSINHHLIYDQSIDKNANPFIKWSSGVLSGERDDEIWSHNLTLPLLSKSHRSIKSISQSHLSHLPSHFQNLSHNLPSHNQLSYFIYHLICLILMMNEIGGLGSVFANPTDLMKVRDDMVDCETDYW